VKKLLFVKDIFYNKQLSCSISCYSLVTGEESPEMALSNINSASFSISILLVRTSSHYAEYGFIDCNCVAGG